LHDTHQSKAILKTKGFIGNQGREFPQGVTRHHMRRGIFDAFKSNDGMQEDGRLCYPGLPEILFRSFKHHVRDAKTKNIIGLLEESFSESVVVVMLLAHSGKLGSLSGKNVSLDHTNT